MVSTRVAHALFFAVSKCETPKRNTWFDFVLHSAARAAAAAVVWSVDARRHGWLLSVSYKHVLKGQTDAFYYNRLTHTCCLFFILPMLQFCWPRLETCASCDGYLTGVGRVV